VKLLSVARVVALHRMIIDASGGSHGLRDASALDSAVAQPRMSFGGQELYPTLAEKAAALSFSLINNHPFVDGNKRIGYEAAIVFLELNGFTISGGVDEKEAAVLAVAAGETSREEWTQWVQEHMISSGTELG
jgi:death-on-curing protein